jgi:uncharacterized alpha-E superfamily protein
MGTSHRCILMAGLGEAGMAVRLLFFLLLLPMAALGQNPKPDLKPPLPPVDAARGNPEQEPNLPEDMRIRMAIERAEDEHRKILESAKQLGELSDSLAKYYHEHGQLSAEEVKKLSAIEKLARRILNHAGGEEFDRSDQPQPTSLRDAIDRIKAAAESIRKSIATQTRFVVSASTIADSNEIIHLTQYIRHAQKATN